MELAVWAVAALIAFGLIVLAVGLAMPIDHVAIRTATFPAEPQALWDAIHDPALARAAAGEVETEEIESVPPKLLVTKVVGEKAFGGTWTFEIGPAKHGSTLTITERDEVYNPIFRFVSRFVMGHHRTIDAYLSRLRRRFAA